jgi:hypothetical protein
LRAPPARQRRQAVAPAIEPAGLPLVHAHEHAVGCEEIRVVVAVAATGIEREGVAGDELLDLDPVHRGQRQEFLRLRREADAGREERGSEREAGDESHDRDLVQRVSTGVGLPTLVVGPPSLGMN